MKHERTLQRYRKRLLSMTNDNHSRDAYMVVRTLDWVLRNDEKHPIEEAHRVSHLQGVLFAGVNNGQNQGKETTRIPG